MAEIRWNIESRIRNLRVLLPEYLTPLLQTQIHHAIELHREALNHPDLYLKDPDLYLKDLDNLHDQFKEHWTKVYGDATSRAILLQDIVLFHQFLVGKLLEDYTNEPYTINKWVRDQAKCIIEQEGAKDGSNVGTAYPIHVIYPLEEMMLSIDYVENKLLRAAAAEGRRGSDIQPLIDRCDWSNLAAALTNDRDLARKLFRQQPFNTNQFDANTYKRILRGIDEIEGKYFAKLKNSMHTREISAEQASNHTDLGSSPPQASAPLNTRQHPASRSGIGWSIYNAIASGFGGTKSNIRSKPLLLPSDDDSNNATFHINSKKAD